MRTAILAAVAAFGLFGVQPTVSPTIGNLLAPMAHADTIQHMASPQRMQFYADAEGSRGGETMYGRRMAAGEQTGVDNGAYRQAAAEQSGVDNGAVRS